MTTYTLRYEKRPWTVPYAWVKAFHDRVRDDGACLVYTMARDPAGYGRMRWKDKTVLAHRLSYELANETTPGLLHVCHACDNPACVFPPHLWLGTDADNLADMGKGRAA